MNTKETLIGDLLSFSSKLRITKADKVEGLRSEIRAFTKRVLDLPVAQQAVFRKVMVDVPPGCESEWQELVAALQARRMQVV